jgi:transcriptional regulator with XRE-family HTH domain
MLEEITTRQLKLGLSTRQLAQQLGVSPTLLSLVLNNKRPAPSEQRPDRTHQAMDERSHCWWRTQSPEHRLQGVHG